MKKIALLLCCLFTCNSFSQIKKEHFKNAMKVFSNQFNKSEYATIYSSFSSEMQKTVPIKKLIPFLKSIKEKKGKILTSSFYNYRLGWATFKTYFEKDSSVIKIALDKHLNLSGFQVIPLVEKKKENTIVDKTGIKNSTPLILPFHETWFVTWGGDNLEQNYHVESKAQKNAFDFVIKNNDGKNFKSNGITNEDFYAFGKKIISPTNAKVIMVVDGIPDNKPGIKNPLFVSGNTIVLQTMENEFLFFAHFKKHSIKIKEGDIVKQGQLLGLCGNSGNSSEPHLHFHIQNTNNMMTGTGIKSYFKNILVNGIEKNNYSPIKGELIKNNKDASNK